MFVVIDFVEDEEDGWGGLAELLSEGLIDGGKALLRVDKEKDEVCRFHGDVCLNGNLCGEAIVKRGADAAGIDEGAGVASESARRGDTITRDTWLVMDDGDLAAGKAVEEGGFPDIRAAYDGDGGHSSETLNVKF